MSEVLKKGIFIMKKKLAVLMAACMLLISVFAMAGCGKDNSASGDKKKIGILMMIENGAFNDMKDGILEELKAQGYTDENSVIDVKCAQGDATNLQTLAQGMSDGSYDMVFTIATPATQAMVNQNSSTPVFFCAVSAPVAAGIVTDMNTPDKNATGTSNAIPVSDIFALGNKLTPDAKKYGFLYCTSEDNSVNTVKAAKEYCDANGIEYEEATVTNSSEVQQAAQILADKVDAIFIPNDSVIQSSMPLVTEVTRSKKVPVYGSSATMVDSGVFATIAISDKEIGKMTVNMAMQYLKDGKKVSEIPSVVVPASNTVINKKTLEALGLTLSDDVMNSATFVEDKQ